MAACTLTVLSGGCSNGCVSLALLQDLKETGPMMKVQNDLDETKIVLVSLAMVTRCPGSVIQEALHL